MKVYTPWRTQMRVKKQKMMSNVCNHQVLLRGMDAETAQQTVSDFVAEELIQFLSPQDEEPGEIDGEEWYVVGSMRTMLVWGLEGVPIFPEDLQKLRTRLLNEGHGPEVSLTLACRNLNEYIRELEMTRDVAWRNEIRSGRNTLRFLQHLLGMMHQNKPKAFHAAVITFVAATFRSFQTMRQPQEANVRLMRMHMKTVATGPMRLTSMGRWRRAKIPVHGLRTTTMKTKKKQWLKMMMKGSMGEEQIHLQDRSTLVAMKKTSERWKMDV